MREGRWDTITESHFNHERAGLDKLRAALPDAEPWRAWSNFTFTSPQGLPREVDVLVIAPNGLHLLELKDWVGRVRGAGTSWVQDAGSGRTRVHHNPLHLANQKAKELRSLLQAAMGNRANEVPWITASVLFTRPGLGIDLPPNDQAGLYCLGEGPKAALPEIMARLAEPPRGERDRVDMARSKALAKALKDGVGVRRSDAEYRIGPWKLDREPLDTGPTWADFIGRHTSITDLRRIRIYYRERNADRELSESIDRAARREAQVLQGIRHPGIVQVADFDP
ncbi:MAG: NERD domain-containing protein [Streptomyces sp.]|uniref:NERD domain-containing protein n=1 Tax=Streptomyces sp. TaxID=1931 RepID=UPI0025E4435B|nr:NERD domain-containing protein [Streptomyces sp.]MBW8801581.1 NERD domain-containing protein [Streptomyces sp.]